MARVDLILEKSDLLMHHDVALLEKPTSDCGLEEKRGVRLARLYTLARR